MCKVFENTFRAVNVALVNEVAQLCDRMGIEVWEVLNAAGTKPFGMMRFSPGPGVGGHCLPLDPFYFAWKARQYDFHMLLTEVAAEINRSMPRFVREKVARSLNARGKALNGSHILILGLTYKRNVDDWQESPSLKLLRLLEDDEALVEYHDPHVPSLREPSGSLLHSVPLTAERLASSDCTLIATDHDIFDYDFIVEHSRLVVDTRNATKDVRSHRERIVLL
jgi:UDP-N-acetyl-D-glucosamine dehydrogenase